MTRTHGRAPRGDLLVAKVPHGRWRTLTFLRCERIDAPCVIDGPINGESFLTYIDQVLVQAIRAAGAKLFFLPPYRPDLNPIEQVFAKLKSCSERPPGEP